MDANVNIDDFTNPISSEILVILFFILTCKVADNQIIQICAGYWRGFFLRSSPSAYQISVSVASGEIIPKIIIPSRLFETADQLNDATFSINIAPFSNALKFVIGDVRGFQKLTLRFEVILDFCQFQ